MGSPELSLRNGFVMIDSFGGGIMGEDLFKDE